VRSLNCVVVIAAVPLRPIDATKAGLFKELRHNNGNLDFELAGAPMGADFYTGSISVGVMMDNLIMTAGTTDPSLMGRSGRL
jgi:hypothetical protein